MKTFFVLLTLCLGFTSPLGFCNDSQKPFQGTPVKIDHLLAKPPEEEKAKVTEEVKVVGVCFDEAKNQEFESGQSGYEECVGKRTSLDASTQHPSWKVQKQKNWEKGPVKFQIKEKLF